MKAVRQLGYGDPASVLAIEEVERPTPTAQQALVRVQASSVNSGDWRIVLADPFIVRLASGLRRPRDPAVGGDFAGVVEAVGESVAHLQPGDEVYGLRHGAFADYVVTQHVDRKPANLSFEEAAAVPIAALTALQALRDKGALKPGEHVLVNGAGGGVGTFAVQIAKSLGATVSATTRPDKADLLSALGADHVIDYTSEDFTTGGSRYDLIVDVGGRRSLRAMRRALKPGGRFVQVGAARGGFGVIGRMIAGFVRQKLLRQQVIIFISKASRDDLNTVREWIEAGRVRPVVERAYPLSEIAQAIAYAARERAGGKIVIKVAED